MSGRGAPWRPVVAWVLVILAATSVPLPGAWSRWRVSGLDATVHAALYGVLGWLVGAALRRTGRRGWRAVVAALLAIAAFAALDEAHQAWTPGRVPAAGDWLADVAGAALGLAAGTWIGGRRAREDEDTRKAAEGGRPD